MKQSEGKWRKMRRRASRVIIVDQSGERRTAQRESERRYILESERLLRD